MINILMKNGHEYEWNEEQYTDYMVTGGMFVVVKGKQWIGMYNTSELESIEVV